MFLKFTYNDFEVVVGLTKTPILARASILRWSSLPENPKCVKKYTNGKIFDIIQ